MGQPRPVMISLRSEKDLGLVLQSSEGFTVQDPVTVPLEHGPDITGLLIPQPSQGILAQRSIGA